MSEDYREHKAWGEFLQHLCAQQLVDNVECKTVAISTGGHLWPVTLNLKGKPDTSWVAGLRNAYGPYARAESRMVGLSKPLVVAGDVASFVGERVLNASGISDALALNNWLISTNLLTPEFDVAAAETARAQLQALYPGQAVLIRSLLREHHAELMSQLGARGWLFLPTRQVWLMDDLSTGEFRKRRDIKADLKLCQKMEEHGQWSPADSFNEQDWTRAVSLYDQLYRVKYPQHNPAYNLKFFQMAHSSRWLEIKGWRNGGGQLDGIVGLLRRPGWLSCPLLGYDITRPSEEGLYRRLSLQSILAAESESRILHLSSGAGLFKQTRGAHQAVEHAAVHVPTGGARQWLARALSGALSHWAAPMLATRAF